MNTPEQPANHTRYDRYPDIFRVARQAAGAQPQHVLSFGCSTGEEPQTLAEKYFPQSRILGVDTSRAVLDKARALTAHLANVTIVASKAAAIAASAPYDVVFAMSVLCRNPAPKDWKDFPFERFESRVSELAQWLRSGGVFVLVNANYNLTQSRLIRLFDLVASPDMEVPRQVWKLAPDGRVLEKPGGGLLQDKAATDCIFRKRETPWPEGSDIPLRIVSPQGADLVTLWLNFPDRT